MTNTEELKDNSGALKEQFLKLTSMKGLFHEVGNEAIKQRFMNMATDDKLKAMSVFGIFT
jgi:hypothetical protein